MKGKAQAFLTLIVLPLLASTILSGCEDCYECDINRPEPYFNVRFINHTELEVVKKNIILLDTLIVNKRKELVDDATDEEYDAIEATIDSLSLEKKKLDDRRKLIQTGSLHIDTLYSSTGDYKIYSDSLAQYQFPLSMNNNSSTYYIVIGDQKDTVTVTYTTELTVENGSVVISADSISDPAETTYLADTLYYGNDQRLTDDTYLYLYF